MVGGCGCDDCSSSWTRTGSAAARTRVERLVESAAENLGRLRYAEETGRRALPSVLALNKVDLFEAEDRDELKRLARRLSAMHPFDHLYPISAKRGKGTQALLDHFLLSAPTRPWDLEPTRATDRSMIDQAIEVVRECVSPTAAPGAPVQHRSHPRQLGELRQRQLQDRAAPHGGLRERQANRRGTQRKYHRADRHTREDHTGGDVRRRVHLVLHVKCARRTTPSEGGDERKRLPSFSERRAGRFRESSRWYDIDSVGTWQCARATKVIFVCRRRASITTPSSSHPNIRFVRSKAEKYSTPPREISAYARHRALSTTLSVRRVSRAPPDTQFPYILAQC